MLVFLNIVAVVFIPSNAYEFQETVGTAQIPVRLVGNLAISVTVR